MIISMEMVQYGIMHRTNPVRRDGMRNTPSFVAPHPPFSRAEREKRKKKLEPFVREEMTV